MFDRAAESAIVSAGQQRPRIVVVQLASKVHVRRRLGLAQRERIGPAATEMRPGVDRIEFNGDFRQFKRRLCLVEIAKDPGMHEMLDVVHLHKAAVERRESRIFPDRVAKDHDRPLPAFLVELRDEILAAQPAVVKIERKVGFACQPARSRCGG